MGLFVRCAAVYFCGLSHRLKEGAGENSPVRSQTHSPAVGKVTWVSAHMYVSQIHYVYGYGIRSSESRLVWLWFQIANLCWDTVGTMLHSLCRPLTSPGLCRVPKSWAVILNPQEAKMYVCSFVTNVLRWREEIIAKCTPQRQRLNKTHRHELGVI